MRANERFSGRGHARHLCKECAKLGKEELAYRQEVRNIDRLLDWDGFIRRRQRKSFERFLSHADARVREYAAEVAEHDARLREAHRQERLTWQAEALVWEMEADAREDRAPEQDG